MATDAVPFMFPCDSFTGVAHGAIVAKTFVTASGAPVDGNYGLATCGAGIFPIGVASRDTADTVKITAFCEGIQPVTAGAALTAGQDVMSDASGNAIPWVWAANGANRPAGKVMADTAQGDDAPIKLR